MYLLSNISAFSPERATFSLGKSVLGFSSDVFARKTPFHSVFARLSLFRSLKAISREYVAHKGGSAFTERTRVCLAKTCPGKAETLFTERNDASKGKKAFPEQKRRSRKGVL